MGNPLGVIDPNSFCHKHGVAKVHRKPPMRGWFCNQCNNEKRLKWYRSDPRTVMVLSAKMRAKRDGIPFSLKKTDIVIPEVCPVLGVPLRAGTRKQHEYAPTLDRITASLGYVVGNVRVVSYRANRIKNDASLDELAKVLAYYSSAVTNNANL